MDEIEFIKEPFLTEDGFVNPACVNELTAFIKNLPPSYERLSNDPEWAIPRWTFWREIVGALALWSVRQITGRDPIFPPGLENILGYVGTCLRPQFDELGMAKLSLCDINKMLYDILMDQGISTFDSWNDEKVMGKGWLDLYALLHNVCLTIRNERRKNDEFDRKFKEEYGNDSEF